MKKIIGLFVFCLLVFSSGTGFADIQEIHTVADYGDTLSQDVFDIDETPWLYLKLSAVDNNFIQTAWLSPTNDRYEFGTETVNTDEWWIPLSEWETRAEPGEWRAGAMLYLADNPQDLSNTKFTRFTVTPEPLGCALFALGGMALAFFRRKRKSA